MIWQNGPSQLRLLCPVPIRFVDSYPVMQEWEKCSDGRGCVLRLDYLNYLPLPAGTDAQRPANLNKLKAALNIQNHSDLVREVQIYHTINRIYSISQATEILLKMGFYRPSQGSRGQPRRLEPPVLRVAVTELLDDMETMPSTIFSDSALRAIQSIRHQRHQRRQITRKFLNLTSLA